MKVCYAMTIHKSQGQSLNKIGVYLPEPIFGHGQLYVALSRATSPHGLKILTRKQENQPEITTKNIVYKYFLIKIANTQVSFINIDANIFSFIVATIANISIAAILSNSYTLRCTTYCSSLMLYTNCVWSCGNQDCTE